MGDDQEVTIAFLRSAIHQLQQGQTKIRHCLDQIDDGMLWWRPHEAQNSIANLMLHLEGNVRQWIISGIGGEPDIRDRPHEFAERGPLSVNAVWQHLHTTIEEAVQVLTRTQESELLKTRRIQGFETNGLAAVFDSVAHFRGHVQEIISLTRQQLGKEYRFYFVPKTKEQGA